MKCYLPVLFAFLVMINVALGAVGGVSGSDMSTYLQPAQSLTGTGSVNSAQSPGLDASLGANVPYQGGSSIQDGYLQPQQSNYAIQDQQASVSPQGSGTAYPAPETGGPVQDQMTAEVLRLSPPTAESFVPDENLNFVSSSSPGKMAGTCPPF